MADTLTPAGLDIRAISPAAGDKFSPNLYKWLTMPRRNHRSARVFADRDGVLWIGSVYEPGWFIGARLLNVLCMGRSADSTCIYGLRGLTEVLGFWERYAADGRCAIDTQHEMHFMGDKTRWQTDGDTRRCLWCGNFSQVLKRWTETLTVEREAWVTEEVAHG